ncbi:MAG: endonuclease domain-containing protein [Clostridia bacterium]|nr:endonuclease domain-containing protein [Clostridia bacterium]
MINYKHSNISAGKALRKNMTPWERKLWFTFLKDLPVKIYKQKLIGDYIVDFYCASKKTAIELDGSQHYMDEAVKHDGKRTEYLNSLGISVLRYSNKDIDKNFKSVCEDIYNQLFL